jgi:heme O synthase-like polyprenyltransferase
MERRVTCAHDYAELTKTRVASLIMMTVGCGYYFGYFKFRRSVNWLQVSKASTLSRDVSNIRHFLQR